MSRAPRTNTGLWTEAFERLHHAATTGAPREEVERMEAAEAAELLREEAAGSESGWDKD